MQIKSAGWHFIYRKGTPANLEKRGVRGDGHEMAGDHVGSFIWETQLQKGGVQIKVRPLSNKTESRHMHTKCPAHFIPTFLYIN